MDHFEMIAVERRALADDLDGLTDEQWATPSLCGEWTVRQVAGHLVVPHKTSLRKFVVEMAKAAGNFDKANARMAVREGERPPTELVADIRRHADGRFTPPGFKSEAPLTDILIHSMDIRVPLGLPTERPTEPFRIALDLLMTPKARRAFVAKGMPPTRFVATDLDWASGTGPEVSGTARDLTISIAGRNARIGALSGDGVAALAPWIGG